MLSHIDGLAEEHLDALIESRLRGDGWIPPAIARIGTPAAIRFLVEELKKERQSETQIAVAFECLGEKGVPYLVELFRDSPADERLLCAVGCILGELKDKAVLAIDPLEHIALDNKANTNVRIEAIAALGRIGPLAQRSTPSLRQVARAAPDVFQAVVNEAIVQMRGPSAAAVLTEQLANKPEPHVFIRLAELGVDGQESGATLLRLLEETDWQNRLLAARTLGFVGYTNAGPALIESLKNEDDWRLVYVAAESLGRIKAGAALSALGAVSETHWYPPVREAAHKAIEAIHGRANYESNHNRSWFPFEFMAYESAHVGKEAKNGGEDGRWNMIAELGRMMGLSQVWLAGLRYRVDERVYEPPHKGGLGMEARIIQRKVIPGVSVRVEDGHILGRDMGGFGGELMYLGKRGKQSLLLNENTLGIHRMTSGIVAVTGLAHMCIIKGCLYRITKSDTGWSASRWKALPGAPRSSRLLSDGTLYVRCTGGSVCVSSSGIIGMAPESEDLVDKDSAMVQGVTSILFLAGGFVVVFVCGVALLFPYFRSLLHGSTLFLAGFAPCAFAVGMIFSRAFGCAPTAVAYAWAATLVIAVVPAVWSCALCVKGCGFSGGKRYAYTGIGVVQVLGMLWAFGASWVVGSVLGLL